MPQTPGAVGMWLWLDIGPRMNRSGSITVWTAHDHLQGFVARQRAVQVAERSVPRSRWARTIHRWSGSST